MECGNISLNEIFLVKDFEFELLSFPNGKNDDQVDAFSYIVQMVNPTSHSFLVGSKKKEEKN